MAKYIVRQTPRMEWVVINTVENNTQLGPPMPDKWRAEQWADTLNEAAELDKQNERLRTIREHDHS